MYVLCHHSWQLWIGQILVLPSVTTYHIEIISPGKIRKNNNNNKMNKIHRTNFYVALFTLQRECECVIALQFYWDIFWNALIHRMIIISLVDFVNHHNHRYVRESISIKLLPLPARIINMPTTSVKKLIGLSMVIHIHSQMNVKNGFYTTYFCSTRFFSINFSFLCRIFCFVLVVSCHVKIIAWNW